MVITNLERSNYGKVSKQMQQSDLARGGRKVEGRPPSEGGHAGDGDPSFRQGPDSASATVSRFRKNSAPFWGA